MAAQPTTPAGEPLPPRYDEVASAFQNALQPASAALQRRWAKKGTAGLHEFWQHAVSTYSRKTFYEAVNDGGLWTDDELNLFGSLGVGTGGFDSLFQVGWTEMLR